MAGIQEARTQVDAIIGVLQEHQSVNHDLQLAHSEALSFGEPALDGLEKATDIPIAAKELDKARGLGSTVEEGFGKIITGIERGLKAIGGVEAHVHVAIDRTVSTSVHLKDSVVAYSGLHSNLLTAKGQAYKGDQLAERAANRLQAAQDSPFESVGQDVQGLAEAAHTYHTDVAGEAKKILKVRNGDSPRLQRIDAELEGVTEALTYLSDKPLKNSRLKIEAGLRLLREGLGDFVSSVERLEAPQEKLNGSHGKIVDLQSDVREIVTLLGSEKSTPQNMARSSAEIQEQFKTDSGVYLRQSKNAPDIGAFLDLVPFGLKILRVMERLEGRMFLLPWSLLVH